MDKELTRLEARLEWLEKVQRQLAHANAELRQGISKTLERFAFYAKDADKHGFRESGIAFRKAHELLTKNTPQLTKKTP